MERRVTNGLLWLALALLGIAVVGCGKKERYADLQCKWDQGGPTAAGCTYTDDAGKKHRLILLFDPPLMRDGETHYFAAVDSGLYPVKAATPGPFKPCVVIKVDVPNQRETFNFQVGSHYAGACDNLDNYVVANGEFLEPNATPTPPGGKP